MQTTIETLSDISSISRKMTFTVLKSDIDSTTKKQLHKISKSVKIAGFRPGKVPLSIVEKNYGYTAFNEALDKQVSETFTKIVNDNQLRIAGRPSISPIEDHPNTDELAFNATFEVYPKIVFGDFKSIPLDVFQSNVTDSDVEETLSKLRKQRAVYTVVDKAAELGDKLNCNFIGKLDGTPFEGGTAEQFNFELGAGRMLPEFETAAIGIKAGETRVFDLTFPQDYPAETLKGKTTQFELTALSVETPNIPELDSEFAKLMGFENGDIIQLKTDIKINLEREINSRMRLRSKQSALDAMLANSNFEAPKVLVDEECALQKEQFKTRMKEEGIADNNSDIPLEAFVEHSIKRVKLGLALGELITQNNLQAKPDQVRQKIDEISASYQKPEEVAAWYFGNRERLQEIEALVLEDNAVEWLINHCMVTKITIPFKEVMTATEQ